MKDVDACDDSMEEFQNNVPMRDTRWCQDNIKFDRACTIRNHVMLVTEFAPVGLWTSSGSAQSQATISKQC